MGRRAALDASKPVPRRARIAKYAAWAYVGAVGAGAAAACSSSSNHHRDAQAIVEGVKGVPECCAPQTYIQLPTVNCTGVDVACPGGVAYSECLEGQFAPCQCTVPDGGWMLAGTCTDAGVCTGSLIRWCDASDIMGVDVFSLLDTSSPMDAGETSIPPFDSGGGGPPDVSSMGEPPPADVHTGPPDVGPPDVAPPDVARPSDVKSN